MIQATLLTGRDAWTLSQNTTDKVNKYKRNILPWIINENGVWTTRIRNELK